MVTLSVAVDKNAGRVLRTVALAADQLLVLATPVDEGRARSNWLVGINSPRRDTVPALDKTGQAAINQAGGAVAEAKSGDTVWISNNLPYIQKLNRGHSDQANPGWVEKAVQTAKKAARGVDLLRR